MIEHKRKSDSVEGRRRPPLGAGCVVVPCGARNGVSEIEVEFFLPPDPLPSAPFLFLVHGRERDAERYRDAWIPLARSQRRILLAPRFRRESFPGSASFNQGDVLDERGVLRERERWSLAALEGIFDVLSAWFGHRIPYYDVYGHSAGAQFVHRLVLLLPEARVRTAVAANAGWYTLPDFRANYPYGLRGTPIGPASLKKAFRRNLVVLLGAEDTDAKDPTLRRLPRAHAQGSNRLERGTQFFERSRAAARKLGAPFAWRSVRVPGVDHDHVAMIPAVAASLGPACGEGPQPGSPASTHSVSSRAGVGGAWWRSLGLGFLQGL